MARNAPNASTSDTLETCEKKLRAFENATKALHGTFDGMPCRDNELCRIRDFVSKCLSIESSGVLFLSGSPGTGKTACVDHVLQELVDQTQHVTRKEPLRRGRAQSLSTQNVSSPLSDVLRVNAVGMRDVISLLERVGPFLGATVQEAKGYRKLANTHGVESVVDAVLNRRVTKQSPMRILVVDEIDQLFCDGAMKSGQEVGRSLPRTRASRHRTGAVSEESDGALETFFSLFQRPESKTLLIAIANSVALAHDVSRCMATTRTAGICPVAEAGYITEGSPMESILFEPYDVKQLKTIVVERLSHALEPPTSAGKDMPCLGNAVSQLVDDGALEFCIRKVCASQGDCRKALDATKRILASRLRGLRESYETLKISEAKSLSLQELPSIETECGESNVTSPGSSARKKRGRRAVSRSTPLRSFDHVKASPQVEGIETPTNMATRTRLARKKVTAAGVVSLCTSEQSIAHTYGRRRQHRSAVESEEDERPTTASSSSELPSVYATPIVRSASSVLPEPETLGSATPVQIMSNSSHECDALSPCGEAQRAALAEVSKAVSFNEVRSLLDAQLKNEKQRKIGVVKGLPQHQQLLLCAACLIKEDILVAQRKAEEALRVDGEESGEEMITSSPLRLASSRNGAASDGTIDPTVLQARYTELCRQRKIPLISFANTIANGLEGLQNCGLIALAQRKPKNSRAGTSTPFRSPKKRQVRNPLGGCAMLGSGSLNSAAIDILDSHTDILAALKEVNGFFGGIMESEGI